MKLTKATSIAFSKMDAITTDVLEELKLKYGEGRITEDQICLKCGKKLTAIPKASMRGAMVFCRSMPTTVCFVKKFKDRLGVQSAAKRKRKTKSTYYRITLCLRLKSHQEQRRRWWARFDRHLKRFHRFSFLFQKKKN